ncbi:helicase RepA family protein [Microvirga sp. VF16]|uniref:helicase RepA family protein n=1 Tax=Microvirga sp. VF16 TaxID=2807101 RepID=UPI00193D89A6|nr:helicase RepA family protein [Microvirga sp. VF16]QRM35850.1 AAA family ATPase [Microvirga sp. VF16]
MSIVTPVPDTTPIWTPSSFEAFGIDLMSAFTTMPPPPDFVLPGLPMGTIGVLVSPGATGKSVLAAMSCLSVAAGADIGHIWNAEIEPGPAVYVGIEDPKDVLQGRLHHIGQSLRKDLPPEVFQRAAENAHFFAMPGEGFAIATRRNGLIVPHDSFKALEARLMAMPVTPRILVLDTLNRCIATGGICESDNGDMGAVVGIVEGTAKRVGCAGILLHHTSKSTALNGQGDAQQAARGASAITDNARWQANLIGMSKEEARKLLPKGDEAKRRSYVRLELTKVNYCSPPDERWLKRGEGGVLSYTPKVLGQKLP